MAGTIRSMNSSPMNPSPRNPRGGYILDIGSNSVRGLSVRKTGGSFHFGQKTLLTTRLAADIDANGALHPSRILATVQAIAYYANEAKEQALPVYAYATSAIREASNREEILSLIQKTTGVSVTLLTGEQEGRFAYLGATQGAGTLIDIGGGSFQVVTDAFSQSYPIGCVRAKDRCPSESLPVLWDTLSPWLDSVCPLKTELPSPVFGVGGTITTLGALMLGQTRFDGSKLSDVTVTPDSLSALLKQLSELENRASHPLLTKRHDVILQGGTILLWLMRRLHIDVLHPSDRDGMEGYAYHVLSD